MESGFLGSEQDSSDCLVAAAAAAAGGLVVGVAGKAAPAKAARRRRLEIRKFKLIANSDEEIQPEVAEPLAKKPRASLGIFLQPSSTSIDFSIGFMEADVAQGHGISISRLGSIGNLVGSQCSDGLSDDGTTALLTSSCSSASDLSSTKSSQCMASDCCPPHGFVSICGRRREMEDTVSVVPSFMTLPCKSVGTGNCRNELPVSLHFFGVYDGHGGSQVASLCKEHLHHHMVNDLKNSNLELLGSEEQSAELKKAVSTSFRKMDAQVGGFCYKKDGDLGIPSAAPAPETVGSTAVVAVVAPHQIIVANCGDSRAVLSRGGQAIPLSKDHKPDCEEELSRVEAAGGRVIFWNGHRVLGVLAMSRAIGDRYLKPYIIAEPDVICTERTLEDECLILASDGLWDVLSNELVCEITRRCLAKASSSDTSEESAANVAAALLAKFAFARGSSDNISVVVVDLRLTK